MIEWGRVVTPERRAKVPEQERNGVGGSFAALNVEDDLRAVDDPLERGPLRIDESPRVSAPPRERSVVHFSKELFRERHHIRWHGPVGPHGHPPIVEAPGEVIGQGVCRAVGCR